MPNNITIQAGRAATTRFSSGFAALCFLVLITSSAPSRADEIVDEFNRRTARSNAEKAAYEAAIAAHKLELEMSIGTIAAPADAPKGAVTVESGGGKAEATLLAAKALATAGKRIADDVKNRKDGTCHPRVVLVSGPNALQFPNYQQFNLRVGLLKSETQDAITAYDEAVKAKDKLGDLSTIKTNAVPALAFVAGALDAFSKIGRYFQSDYKFGGLEPTVDNEVLLSEIGRELIGCTSTEVIIPSRRIQTSTPILAIINERRTQLTEVATAIPLAEEDAKNLKAKADKAPPARKKDIEAVAEQFARAAAQMKRAVENFTAFFTYITSTPDPKLPPVLSNVLAEYAVVGAIYKTETGGATRDNVIEGTVVLEASTKGTGGGYYTQSNLWTFFGSAPFHVMAAALVNYSLTDPKTERLIATDTIAVHGGYVKVSDVQEEIK